MQKSGTILLKCKVRIRVESCRDFDAPFANATSMHHAAVRELSNWSTLNLGAAVSDPEQMDRMEPPMLPELETPRLMLRELSPSDASAMQEWRNSPTQWQLQAVEPAEFSDAGARIANYLKYRGEGATRWLFDYVARHKGDGSVIGGVSLARSHREVATVGVGVAARHCGCGYGTEMVRRLVDFGFGDLRFHRIAADVAIENHACIRLLEKVGLRFEGVSRDRIRAQGRWWTEARYAILASDAEALR